MQESSLQILESVNITREQGGFYEFERTGVYPDYYVFKSSLLKKTWRQKARSETQSGVIKSMGRPIFHYKFGKIFCKLQYVASDGTVSKWMRKEVILVLFD